MKAKTKVRKKKAERASAVIERWKRASLALQKPDLFSAEDNNEASLQAAFYELPAFFSASVVPGPFEVPGDMADWALEDLEYALEEYAKAYLKRWEQYALGFEDPESRATPSELRELAGRVNKVARRLFWTLYLMEKRGKDVDLVLNGLYRKLKRAVKFSPRLRRVNWEKYFEVPF